jgi:hypothetical protein
MAYTLNSRTKWVGFFFSSMPILSLPYKAWIFACFFKIFSWFWIWVFVSSL